MFVYFFCGSNLLQTYHLFFALASLAEALDMQPPVMHEDGHTTRVTSGDDSSSAAGKESSAVEAVWDDEDTRSFYECLPDLRFVF